MRYQTTRRGGWLTWAAVLVLASSAWAKAGDGSELKGAMGGGDEAAARAAVEEAAGRMAETKLKPVRDWFAALFKAKRYELAAELAGRGLLVAPGGAFRPGEEQRLDELASRRAEALAKLPVATHGEAGSSTWPPRSGGRSGSLAGGGGSAGRVAGVAGGCGWAANVFRPDAGGEGSGGGGE